MHVGQAEVAALVFEGELGVVDAEQVHHGRVQVVDVDGVFGDVVTVVVGLAVAHAGFDSAARHEDREASRVMVAAVVVLGEASLAVDGAAELAAPNDERVFEHSAVFEVFNQRASGLIGVFGLFANALGEFNVLVPATVEELDEANAPLRQPPCKRQLAAKVPGLRASLP